MHVRLHLFFVASLRLEFSASDCATTLANKPLWTAERIDHGRNCLKTPMKTPVKWPVSCILILTTDLKIKFVTETKKLLTKCMYLLTLDIYQPWRIHSNYHAKTYHLFIWKSKQQIFVHTSSQTWTMKIVMQTRRNFLHNACLPTYLQSLKKASGLQSDDR